MDIFVGVIESHKAQYLKMGEISYNKVLVSLQL